MSKKKKSAAADEHRSGTEVNLGQMNIFLSIPTETVCVEVIAGLIGSDGKLMKVSTTLSASEIREKRQAFFDNVEFGDDYDGKFVITEEGRRYLEGLRANHEA